MIAELTRSDLSLVARCPRKYWYAKVLGLEEGPSSKAMSEGTIIHRGLEVAYRTAQGFDLIAEDNGQGPALRDHHLLEVCQGAGVGAIFEIVSQGEYVYRGKTQALNADALTLDTRERLVDAFTYFMNHTFLDSLHNKKVVAIEKDFEYEIDVGVPVTVAGTLDLVLQDRTSGTFEVWDHKCVGQIGQALRFLSMDIQMNTYENMVCEALGVEDVEMVYNLIRRDRPPGYGSRPLTTKSGAKSTASTKPEDYLQAHRWSHTAKERFYTQRVLEEYARVATRLSADARLATPPLRVPIKTGGEACMTSCVYNSRCAAEMLGYAQPTWEPAPIVESSDD